MPSAPADRPGPRLKKWGTVQCPTLADLDARIAVLETELVDLRRRRADLHEAAVLRVLATVIPLGVCFTAVEVLAHAALHPDLAAAIRPMNAHRLGMYLARLARRRPQPDLALERVGRDALGCSFQLTASS